ncbi:MAG TPA: ABC transporter permease [Candidatus Methylomirabilis sp.]|nr:ABC transporter permease [Candidatus Methylomirabilis sp.]
MRVQALTGMLKTVFLEVQEYFRLSWSAVRKMFSPPFYYREFAIQMDKIGVGSLFIIILTGAFTGMVMALQFLAQLKPFAATSYVGGMVMVTMVKELGPVLSALMVAGRVGSAITAELGTMVVTEQVDAMQVEGTDIVKRLVTPRLKAILVSLPLLTVVTDAVSVVGGYAMAAGYGIKPIMYINSLTQFMFFIDYAEGLVKPLVFGFIIAMMGCYTGLRTYGGAAGVGEAAKRTVVLSSILILIVDFFIAKIFVTIR